MKRLALLVEGDSELRSMPALVGKILYRLPDDLKGNLFVDDPPLKMGGIESISGRKVAKFDYFLNLALNRKNVGGILVVLDGDADEFESSPFCVKTAAQTLVYRAKAVGAGNLFSIAVVILKREFESFLIASAHQFARLKEGVSIPPNVEEVPRDAKRWLKQNLEGGYKEVMHQRELTHEIQDLTAAQQLRSFQRLEKALIELAIAVRDDNHVATPAEIVLES